MLPKKLKRTRIKKTERLEWPRHRRFVKSHECAIMGLGAPNWSDCCNGRIEFAHIRLGTHTGMKQTPHDRFGISLCRKHHREAHKTGEATFQQKYKFDWQALAAEFVSKSPDLKMRACLAERKT